MTTHQASEQLREEAITLPQNHILRKLVPIGLVLGVLGMVATFALSSMYGNFWPATAPAHGKSGHAAAKGKKGKKHHNKAAKAKAAHAAKAHTKTAKVAKHGKTAKKGKHAAAHGHHTPQPQIWGSYLVAFLFFLSIALGALFFVFIHFASRAGWSTSTRRLAEFVLGALPFLALAFIPFFIFGKGTLYHHWLVPDPNDVVLARKIGYFDINFFTGRAIFYFAFWVIAGSYFARKSMLQDRIGGEAITRKLQWWSYICIFFFAWTSTFAAFDWIMSIDPHWYSTIFGLYFFAGCVVAIMAFLAIFSTMLHGMGFLKGIITTEHKHDLGKLMYGFMIFWTYMGFSQFMLIWYANIPEETMWYQYRMFGDWKNLTIFLALGHFLAPFFLLMSRHVKRNTLTLCLGAGWMLFIHFVDLYWLVIPTLYSGHGATTKFAMFDLLPLLSSVVAVGGFFLAGLGWWMRSAKLAAVRDPRFAESLKFENF